VKGNTLAEKAEFFKGKISEGYNPDDWIWIGLMNVYLI
jgi:hypothetical protein